MRIAMFVGGFPLVSETFILRQICGLLDLGHDVDVFAEERPPDGDAAHPEVKRYDLLRRTRYIDIPPAAGWWEMPVWPLSGDTWLPGADAAIPNVERLLEAAPVLSACYRRAPALAREVVDPTHYDFQAESLSALYRLGAVSGVEARYDIAHAHFGPVARSYRFVKALWNVPFVATFHGYDFCTYPRKHGRDVYRRLFEDADLVTVNSDYTRRRVEALGCDAERLRTLPVGLDPREFGYAARVLEPGGAIEVLSVGRLVEIKGHEYAIRAVHRVRDRLPWIRYTIVGDGPRRESLERLITDLGLGEAVRLVGARDAEQVRHALRGAHVFVMPSINVSGDEEGQGLALQEAQAVGLPVIATRTGGLPEGIAEGASGFLVRERDPEALAAALLRIIELHDAWPEMGRLGHEFVARRYDIRELSRRLVELYGNALGEFRGREAGGTRPYATHLSDRGPNR